MRGLKNKIAVLVLTCFLGSPTWAQLYNKGTYVKVAPGITVNALNGVINSDGGTITVDGTINTPADLTNETGALLQGNGQYQVSGDWNDSANFDAGTSTVLLEGNTPGALNSGGGPFYNLILHHDVTLNNSIQIEQALSLINADFELNGSVITLSPGATMSEQPDNTVKGPLGHIITTRNLNAPGNQNVGGMGFELTTGADLGSTEIIRAHAPQTILGNAGILRYFDVTPSNNSGLNAGIVFHYDDSELNGNNESELDLYRSDDGGNSWIYVAGNRDPDANTYTATGIESFSRWTLNSGCPVSTQAACQDITVYLDATGQASITAAEIDGGSLGKCGIQTTSASISTFDCSKLGRNNVTLTVSDLVGGSSSCTAVVTIEDNIAPTITCPANITTDNDMGACEALVTGLGYTSAADNCSLAVNWTLEKTPAETGITETFSGSNSLESSNIPVGTATLTYTVVDAGNNSANCSISITVNDNTPPDAVCQTHTVQLDIHGDATIAAANVDGGSSDNCGIQEITVAPDTFDESNLGSNNVTLTVTDVHGHMSSCSTTVTVTGRATALSYTGATDEQYSDQASLSATLLDDLTGDPIQGRELLFTIGSQTASATTDANGLASATIVLNQAPTGVNGASYTVDVDFIPAAGDWFLGSFQSQDFGIIPEDPIVTYTGVVYASTGGANNSEATLTLTATIQDDPNDGYPGDVSNAVVQFYNSETGDTIGDPLNVMLVNPNDPSTGTVLQNWTVDIQNKDVESYEIGIKVLSYYHREFEADEIITVSRPLNDYVKGGGNFYLENSEGVYAGDDNSALRFSINGKFTPNGNNPKGKVHFLVDRLESDGIVHTYRFKSNNILSVGINSSTNDGWVTGKCSVQDVTDPGNPISLGGNRTFQVEVQDNGQPGALDSIGIAVYHQNGSLLFSSKWSGVQTLRDTLDKGDIEVSAGAQAMNAPPQNGPAGLSIKADKMTVGDIHLFPNPAVDQVKLTFELDADMDIRLEIVSTNGQILRSQSIASQRGANTHRIDLEGLPAGTYWVRVSGKDIRLAKPLVIAN
ncbi:MAG: T9SS type A sorting domain-containing protein [Lewinellaceae bacterium]|nr:T9SS type A sorting domain-containing protein [Lewinellaceae bacterium]